MSARFGLAWRRARPEDAPLAWVWAAGTASALLLVPFAPHVARLSPVCPFHALSGVPCPTCGSTRALLALAALDAPRALAWNPLVVVGLTALAVAGALAPFWVAARAPLPITDERAVRWMRVVVPAALAANWLYLIARGV